MLQGNELFEAVKREIDETGDWATYASILGLNDIHPFFASDEQIALLNKQIKNDSKLVAAFYDMGKPLVFNQNHVVIDEKIASILGVPDEQRRMDVLVNILVDYVHRDGYQEEVGA